MSFRFTLEFHADLPNKNRNIEQKDEQFREEIEFSDNFLLNFR